MDHSHQVDIELALPVIRRQISDALTRRLDTGLRDSGGVNHDVHRPKSRLSVCDHALNIGNDGQIAHDRGRFSTLTPELLGTGVYSIRSCGQGDACTELSEYPRTGKPDARLASATGDNRDVAAKVAGAMVRHGAIPP